MSQKLITQGIRAMQTQETTFPLFKEWSFQEKSERPD